MTTEKQEVSASPESAEGIAAQVSAAQEPAPASGEQTAPAETAKGLTLADLESTFKTYEGRQNNWNAQRMREIEQTVNSRVEAIISPLLERQKAEEIARVEQMEPEDQVAYWKQQATAPEPKPEAPKAQQAQQAQQAQAYSSDDRLKIINAAETMIANMGLNIRYTDERLWNGAVNGMDADQILEIARVNAQKLKAPASQPTPAAPAATPPPSTQAAPSSSSITYGSRTEANAALLSGQIPNIDEFQRIGLQEGWLKKR